MKSRTFNHLSSKERGIIEGMLKMNSSIAKIARFLKRNYHSIYKEIREKSVPQRKQGKMVMTYFADTAERIYKERRKNSVNKYKLFECMEFLDMVEALFRKHGWSIEACVNYIRKNHPEVKSLCSKTVYSYIDRGLLSIKNYELREKSRRKPKKERRKLTQIRVLGDSIDSRPDIEDRLEFGHWEGDTIQGKQSTKECVISLVERKTRLAFIVKVKDKRAITVCNAIIKLIKKHNIQNFKTITLDNGLEFSGLPKLLEGQSINTKIYYAHPYSSWERGTNERFNRIVRYFIKKGEDFANYSDYKIRKIQDWINNLPRSILNWDSSLERYSQECFT